MQFLNKHDGNWWPGKAGQPSSDGNHNKKKERTEKKLQNFYEPDNKMSQRKTEGENNKNRLANPYIKPFC